MEELKTNTVTLEQTQAMQLHSEIMANMRMAASAMVDFCKKLKEMRDGHLYEKLGFEDFAGYAVNMVGIKARQAYNYIAVYERLSPKLLKENAGIGVTKLLLLTEVSAPEREEFAEEHDLAGMTVAEIKALVEEKNGLSEQISMLQDDAQKAQEEAGALKEQVQELKTQLSEQDEEGQIINVDAIRAETEMQLRQEIQAQAEVERMNAIREAREEERETARREYDAAKAELREAMATVASNAKAEAAAEYSREKEELKQAAQAAQKRAEELRETVKTAASNAKEEAAAEYSREKEALEQAVQDAQQRAEELAKKMTQGGNPAIVRFKVIFDGLQHSVNDALGIIEALRSDGEDETAAKLGKALKSLLEMVNGRV